MKKFKTILADPPWPYNSPRAVVGNGGRGSQNGKAANIIQTDVLDHYNVMSLKDIKELPISELVEDNAHLYLWTTNSFMVEAHEVARAWGFKPKTIITWAKIKKDRTPSMKNGYWYRSATEHVLFAVRGRTRARLFRIRRVSPRLLPACLRLNAHGSERLCVVPKPVTCDSGNNKMC